MDKKQSRSLVVCHMLTSLDGKIDGEYMSSPACAPALKAYGELRKFYDCQATIYGTVTMLGCYADGPVPELEKATEFIIHKDYLAPCDVDAYIISVDPKGELGFQSGYIEKKGRPRAHVIEVLTEQVSDSFLQYLQKQGVSYIFAGEEYLDCKCLVEKLRNLFGIEKLMVAGGGYMNYSFLHEKMIDEISIVVAPVADGNTKSVSIFEKSDFLAGGSVAAFEIKDLKRLEGNTLWLRYQPVKE